MLASLNACNYCWQCEQFKLNKHLYSNDELTALTMCRSIWICSKKEFQSFFFSRSYLSAANMLALAYITSIQNVHDRALLYANGGIAQPFEQFTFIHKGKLRMHKISQWSNENCFSFVPEIFLFVSVSRQVCGKMLEKKSIDKERERTCVREWRGNGESEIEWTAAWQ